MANQEYKYSNGVDLLKAIPSLKSRVGWTGDSQSSASGRYFDDGSFHVVVNQDNLKAAQPKKDISDNEFAAFKNKITEAGISKVLNAVIDRSFILDETALYSIKDASQLSIPQFDFVGFAIDIPRDPEITVKVQSAVLNFSSDCTINIYVFEEGANAPVWEQSVSVTGGKYFIANLTNLYLSYGQSGVSRFYIGYKPSELSGSFPVGGNDVCDMQSNFFNAEYIETNIPFDEDNLVKNSVYAGINFRLQAFRDFTYDVINKASAFDELLGLTVSASVLETIIFSPRINPEQRSNTSAIDKHTLQLDLTGTLPITDAPHITGIRRRAEREIVNVKNEIFQKKTGVVTYD